MASTESTTDKSVLVSLWKEDAWLDALLYYAASGGLLMELESMSKDPLYDILVKDDSASRKLAPVHAGFMRYFPNGMKAIACMSRMANAKHNPGEELGWSWNRSDDHEDCVARHSLDGTKLDEFNLPHIVARGWRAMAALEKALVEHYDLDLPPAAYMVPDDLSEEALEQVEIDKAKRVDVFGVSLNAQAHPRHPGHKYRFWD